MENEVKKAGNIFIEEFKKQVLNKNNIKLAAGLAMVGGLGSKYEMKQLPKVVGANLVAMGVACGLMEVLVNTVNLPKAE